MIRHARYYLFGMIIVLLFVLAAELIWLPAPLRTSSGMLWIDMIDELLYGLAIIPLFWGFGALTGIRRLWSDRGSYGRPRRSWMLLLIRGLLLAVSAAGLLFLLMKPDELIIGLGVLGVALLLLFADLIWSDTVYRRLVGTGGGLRWPWRSLAWLLVTAALFGCLAYPTNYNVTYPGLTMAMNRYAHVDGGKPEGSISGVLVFERIAVPADWLYAKLLPKYSFEKRSKDEPPLTESYSEVVQMKQGADDVAGAIAMGKAGIGKGIELTGARVLAIADNAPAKSLIKAGDVIIALNGKSISNMTELTDYMVNQVKPGDRVEVTLRRGQETVKVQVPTGEAEAAGDLPKRAAFGIGAQNDWHADIPRQIEYRHYIAHIGGPSHGAMLTLALIDQLTPGGVTHGVRVAGTGTIEPDGSIGLVGGIPQKAYAVSRTDADVFFVPVASLEEAKAAAPGLNIVPVKTIDEVLDWLKAHPRA
ncbi:PDZ domain-containing protein [Paenibacillus glycanilyticus]|uniref:PDZ domain-containing protein n=1 Tax=Paenibacillus glycanilyticus TaxID=126569 RepID=UPI00203BC993|nr:PDZ domain-containing protein [Paenibacillus glycanilyticus]MCM3627140.1 PDZ domain-containing protein [Paenibacillus glycanilyticus]